ncbi:MAG TPA: apolipoprotein N-acyltransferase [Pirellulales bacterium]
MFLQSTFGIALLGSLLAFLSLPPADWWPLAWIAPVPWLLLIRQPQLTGRRPYRAVWLAGFAFWLGAIHWLRLPHWTTYFGWLALAFYLAFYLPVFVGLTRVAVHRLHLSVVIAAPLVWTGLELARGHLLGGFTMGSLSHTQIHWLPMIQAADIVGDYGISGLVVFAAACVARIIPWRGERFAVWPIVPLVCVLAATLVYGQWRMSGEYVRPGPSVALIQGSFEMSVTPDESAGDKVFQHYLQLSREALRRKPQLDLLVWPETMYRYGLISFADGFAAPANWLDKWDKPPQEIAKISRNNLHDLQMLFQHAVEEKFQAPLPPPLLLGIDALHITNEGPDHYQEQHYNSALFVDSQGVPLARYDKMHPVMFGEYIPLADVLPFLYRLTPLTGGLTVGTKAVVQKLGAYRFAPDICYETVIPHLIRSQVLELRQHGAEPDVLVNITNDGWFRGSSELNMHLACGVFRAIEMRKPLVVAANTGISAHIDGDGRIVQQAAKMVPDVLIAEVQLDTRHSFYLNHGDWFSGLCLLGCCGLATIGLWDSRARQRQAAQNQVVSA